MDWDHGRYAAFADLRLRPAIDLLARVPLQPPSMVVDLGCGGGAVAAALRARYPSARLVGVDPSPAMRQAAEATGQYDAIEAGDATGFANSGGDAPDLIFSNAALHWAGDHQALFPALLDRLARGGVLAAQMPRQFSEPSHQLLWRTARARHPDRFPPEPPAPLVSPPDFYLSLLAPLCAQLDLWETVYQQRLERDETDLHPVAGFTRSTAARPYLQKLDEGEQASYLAAYSEALAEPYPVDASGGAWLAFRRIFMVARKA